MAASIGQYRATVTCPDTPRLDGKIAVITGGNAGIGKEIAMGLAERGAELIIAARNQKTAVPVCEEIGKVTRASVSLVPLDLSDLDSVVRAAGEIEGLLNGRTIDIMIANAGVCPPEYTVSAQGFELGFAVNVLGHYVFIQRLINSGAFRSGRLIVMTAELYPLARDCHPNRKYKGNILSSTRAYCRTKLGTMWLARGFAKRHPEVEVYPVHPGVIASGISDLSRFPIVQKILLDVERGAQMPLYVATQEDLQPGGYYTNKLGLARLRKNDISLNTEKIEEFWALLEKLGSPYL